MDREKRVSIYRTLSKQIKNIKKFNSLSLCMINDNPVLKLENIDLTPSKGAVKQSCFKNKNNNCNNTTDDSSGLYTATC